MDYSNLTGGLRVQSQIPLNVKENCLNEATLKNLGISNNLAFTYEQGLVVYCFEEESRWEWREVKPGELNTGLLSNDYIYPNGIVTFGIDYSLKSFNFFPYVVDGQIGATGPTGPQGEKGEQGEVGENGAIGPIGITGSPGVNGIDGLSAYEIATEDGFEGTNNEWLLSLVGPQGPQGDTGAQGIDASNNLQKTINNNYVLNNTDNNYTILIDNGVSNVKISYPGGLIENFSVGFIQQGTGLVEFQNIGSGDIYTPVGLNIKGQNYNAYIEQIGTTDYAHLIGNLKP